MPILREWRAEIRRAQSSEYVEYIRNTGLADYRNTAGSLGALIACTISIRNGPKSLR